MNRKSLALSIASSAIVLVPRASANNHYILDDGVLNTAMGYSAPADYGWMQWFDTVGPDDAITKVSLAWYPWAMPPNQIVHVCVWDDPTDDGDPSDALLVAQADGQVGPLVAPAFTDYPLLAPAPVHGRFFVGVFLTSDGTLGAFAALDYNVPYVGRAWFATTPPGYFAPAQMSSNNPVPIEILAPSIHGVFMLRAEGTGTAPEAYCTPKVNSLGCAPQIGSFGTASATALSGFYVTASSERNRTSGLFFYSVLGRASTPFHGGTLCVAAPLRRTPVQDSGGSAFGDDCSGVYSFDFAAWIAAGSDAALIAGATVNGQYYSRDPGFAPPNDLALSNAIEFTLQQ